MYAKIYDLYKKKNSENIYKKWDEYSINIKDDMMRSINQYVPSKNHIKNLKPFRLSKNHASTEVFNHGDMGPQINNQNQIQEMPNILNASQGNQNIIRIEPNRLDELGENLGNDEGDLHMENNLEFE